MYDMYSRKLDSLSYIFVAESVGQISVNLTQLRSLLQKPAVLCEITQNHSHLVVQGHSRSSIFIPI